MHAMGLMHVMGLMHGSKMCMQTSYHIFVLAQCNTYLTYEATLLMQKVFIRLHQIWRKVNPSYIQQEVK